jgi:methylenetetrahydrofolate dehydrogenase (NADP+)/methenyltetrahydrofolate cyclohydrolase
MVQLPLPEHINTHQVLAAIDPKKDGDGLTPYNLGLMFHDDPSAVVTATALGIIKLFETYQIDISGKNAVIINNTSLVGLPLAALFNNRHATATICHKYTQNIEQATLSADIIVSATGVKNLITANMVKSGAVVVDVGGGDVDFENVKVKCSYITPTFGGVGPMTVACLLRNTYELYSRQRSI